MNKNPIEDLQEIRNLMERSVKFVTISGLSGISAGILALGGAFAAYQFVDGKVETLSFYPALSSGPEYQFILIDAFLVLSFSALAGFIFTLRKAKTEGQALWSKTGKQLFVEFCLPLGIGGLFCAFLLINGVISFLAPAMLIFYGLALLNASHRTIRDIRFLAYFQLVLGVVNLLFIPYGFWFWSLGFGVLHLIYGIIIYFKYEG